jgi:hypothetical protein
MGSKGLARIFSNRQPVLRMASLEWSEFIESFFNLQQAILWMIWLSDDVMIHASIA